MTDTSYPLGSSGKNAKLHDFLDGTQAEHVWTAGRTLYPLAPVVTPYTPPTTAYARVVPNAENLAMIVRPRTATDALIFAGAIVHKIADATTIAAANATDLASAKTLLDELMPEGKTHIASTAIHVAAGAVMYPGHKAADTTNLNTAADMSDLATGYVLADEQDDDYNAHAMSDTFHMVAATAVDFGGTPDSEETLVIKANLIRSAVIAHFGSPIAHYAADVENARLATATTPATDTATAQTLMNLLKAYWASHCGIGAAAAADLAAVICHANAVQRGLTTHFTETDSHGGAADAGNLATLVAVPSATDLATAQTLATAEKATLTAHYAITDAGAYQTVPAGQPLEWPCAGAFFCRTSTSGATFTTAEYRAA